MKSVVITGCTSGIGKAFHDYVVSQTSSDLHFVFLGRNLGRLQQNSRYSYFEIDLAKDPYVDWDALFSMGLPDSIAFISNAGVITPFGPITPSTQDSFRNAIKVNMTSPAEIISSLIQWTEVKGICANIINVTSGAAKRPIEGWSAYCVSKAGIRMFLDVLALEHNLVKVTHFDPGVIDTTMQQAIREANSKLVPSVDYFRGFVEEGKLKSPEEVAIELINMCG